MRIPFMSSVRRAVGLHRKRLSDKGLSTIELVGIIVVVGILATIAVLTIGSLIDDAESNAGRSNLNTIVNSIQAIGADRLAGGGFSYTGESMTVSGTAKTAAEASQDMVNSLRGVVTNIDIQPVPAGNSAPAGGIWADGLPPSNPNIVYVAVNNDGYDNGDGREIPAGHMARVVVRSSEETTLCAILVRSTESAGVGFDSWTLKGTGNTDPDWRALCLPARDGDANIAPNTSARNTVNGGPPIGGIDTTTDPDTSVDRAPVLHTTPDDVDTSNAVEERIFVADQFFATLPDPGRDNIENTN